MLIVDGHQDIAYNMLTHGRDITRPVAETRRLEAGIARPVPLDDALLGYPEYRQARLAVAIASLFAAPQRAAVAGDTLVYRSPAEAERLYRAQIDCYLRLADDSPDHFRLVFTQAELQAALSAWRALPPVEISSSSDGDGEGAARRLPPEADWRRGESHVGERAAAEPGEAAPPAGPPVGLVLMMEGAEAIRDAGDVEAWWERGVRIIAPAWRATPYSGGTQEPGPLTSAGFALLERMAALNAGLDLTHMDDSAVLQALDFYTGPLLASHSNARALLRGDESNRQLSDRMIQGIIERDGVIGVVPYLAFLKPGWTRNDGRRTGRLEQLVTHIDHICQIAGDARHVGLGTDFDGGFGLQSVPAEIDSIADLHKLAPLLRERGYNDDEIAGVMGENWLGLLRRILPETI